MKPKQTKTIILICCLIALTCLALANADNLVRSSTHLANTVTHKNGIVTLSGNLVQDKIVAGSDGIVSLALTMTADNIADDDVLKNTKPINHVDMVIVLDRSGSMSGKKLEDAKMAVRELISRLSAADRFAMVAYSDDARRICELTSVTPVAKNKLNSLVTGIGASGGTNLGEGLQTGINLLTQSGKTGNTGRLILISDGLANQGITDIESLGRMASVAVTKEFSISTAGVGHDFNEILMTAIADHGTGNYHFIENPGAFAAVFNNEFEQTRTAAATSLRLCLDETSGIKMLNAGGYPISHQDGNAIFYPGDLISGETRKLFLSLQVPTDRVAAFTIPEIDLQYNHHGQKYQTLLPEKLKIACVNDPKAAVASIDRPTWENKVVKEDFSRLKEEVAGDIKSGRRDAAIMKIDRYYSQQQELNASVQSGVVADNLAHDVKELRETVDETFVGAPSAVAEKQKKNAKVLQYEGYRMRR